MKCFVVAALVVIGGCAKPPAGGGNDVDIGGAAHEAQVAIDAYGDNVAKGTADTVAAPAGQVPVTPPAPGTPGGLPDDRTPVSEAPFTPDSAQGAADVVQTYYALIGAHDYAAARRLWAPRSPGADASDAAFAARFAKVTEYRGQVGAPGAVEAGAGQRYVSVPVQVSARLANGDQVDEIGTAVLHRIADVDGTTSAQRRWQIRSIDIRSAPARPAAP